MPPYQRPPHPTVPQYCHPAKVNATEYHCFRKCSQIGFARRQRHYAADPNNCYTVVPDSLQLSSWHDHQAFVATLSSTDPTCPELLLAIIVYPLDVVRVVIDDSQPLDFKRHAVSGVLVEGISSKSLQIDMLTSFEHSASLTLSNSFKVHIHFDPFVLNLVSAVDGNVLVSVNSTSRLLVENFSKSQGHDAVGSETIGNFTDSKPRGPESVGVDISFPSASQLHGIPERTVSFDIPDTLELDSSPISDPFRFYNLDIPFYLLENPIGLYGCIPLLIARNDGKAVGTFWHNTSETYVDVATVSPNQKNTHWFSESGLVDFFILPGHTPAQVYSQYLSLTGAPAFQQKFVLGYHQCRYSYVDEHDVRIVDAELDKHDIPYDVMWLDIGHTDGMRYFTWDEKLFPNPCVLRDDIAAKGRRLVTIVDPHVKKDESYDFYVRAKNDDLFVKTADTSMFIGACWPGESGYIDFTHEPAQSLWSEQFDSKRYPHFSSAIHIWNDMNEPSVFDGPERTLQKDLLHFGNVEHRHVHNVYGHFMIKATHKGIRAGHGGNLRPFILTRSFFAGSHRYAAVWTGDNTADWSHLKASIRMNLSLQLCGVSMSGADVGGFFGNPDGELSTRWYQAAAFQPFFRGHSCEGTNRREPWLFGEPYTSHIADAIFTRYQFLPYWYTLLAASSVGVRAGFSTEDIAPPMRPVWWEFPKSAKETNEVQWMVGKGLLVAPVVESGATRQFVDLPDGTLWYDLKHPRTPGCKVNTGRVEVDVELGRMVVFQRGGTILPTAGHIGRSTEAGVGENGLTVLVALDENGYSTGKVYIDDGKSYNFENGEYALCEMSLENRVLQSHVVDGRIDLFTAKDGAVIGKVVVFGTGIVTNVLLNDVGIDFTHDKDRNVTTVDTVQLDVAGKWTMVFVE